ncbi:MAG: NAD(P)-dependent oxidoreductase [Bacteroidota bacterium]
MKIGIIREGKTPPDKRVPLTPNQCRLVEEQYPHVEIYVQESPIRAFSDDQYREQGIEVVKNIDDCDVIMGVKEVNIEDLIPEKQFFFFSHTIKRQPYNRDLLRAVVDKRIQLTDYEVLTRENGVRLIGFGRYAGIVGCYNGFRTYGLKNKLYDLKPAHECDDRKEMEGELNKVQLPEDTKIVLTGFGRVGYGAREIIDLLPIKEVTPEEFTDETFDEPVYTHLNLDDYVERSDGKPFDKKAYFKDGSGHVSTFPKYLEHADMFIACHFWKEGSPYLFTREDLKSPAVRTTVVADISCDIDGPVACTIRPSTIADPIYGYDPQTEKETAYDEDGAIAVMAVDNLPCELPKDASEDFGNELIKHILPALLSDDPTDIIGRGSETTLDGQLSPHFSYLSDYLEGKA